MILPSNTNHVSSILSYCNRQKLAVVPQVRLVVRFAHFIARVETQGLLEDQFQCLTK